VRSVTAPVASWLGLVQHVLDKVLTSKVAFRRLIVLLVMTVIALALLVGVFVWIAGPAAVWSTIGAGGLVRVVRSYIDLRQAR
jgi:hypothetical protein